MNPPVPTTGSANPFSALDLAKSQARADMKNRPTSTKIDVETAKDPTKLGTKATATLVAMSAAGDLFPPVKAKRGHKLCDCGKRISATKDSCFACSRKDAS